MARNARYECPTCGATKEIIADHRNGIPNKLDDDLFPIRLVCGWRGCEDFARRTYVCPTCKEPQKRPKIHGVGQVVGSTELISYVCQDPYHNE